MSRSGFTAKVASTRSIMRFVDSTSSERLAGVASTSTMTPCSTSIR